MDAGVNGQVQSWHLNDFSQKSVYEFDTSSRPWHIISSPTESEVFVVLSGDVETPGSAGLSCLSYNENGELSEKWTTINSVFETLHGITVSSDGSKIYVSSRGNGSIHVFDAFSGNLLNTVDGIGMMMDNMDIDMGSLSGIAIIQ
jgi:DNA-binding beta-propeller fold protein YncE